MRAISEEEWKQRFLRAYIEGKGKLPQRYPYNQWASWLSSDRKLPFMKKGWELAEQEYERMMNEG